MPKKQDEKPHLIIRNATLADAPAISDLTKRVYPHALPYTPDQIHGQITHFPKGQFVAEYDGVIVGYCATFRIRGDIALKPHTWKEITGGGYASRHDPTGDYLYGMEVCVDKKHRGLRIGQRFYNERKKLCQYLRLKGIIFGGRLPGLHKKIKQVDSPLDYVNKVREGKFRDPVLSFQLRNGFELLGVLPNYLIHDPESLNAASHMLWKNPATSRVIQPPVTGPRPPLPDSIRVGVVQYKLRRVQSFDEFKQYVEYFVSTLADYQTDFVTFPELFTLQLLSIEKKQLPPAQAIAALTRTTEPFKKFMQELAVRYNVNLIGGTHPTKMDDGVIRNNAYVFLRDGSIHEQAKIHPTPNERAWWNIEGGTECRTIMTDCGPIGVLVCYDLEFPEVCRHLVNQGATIIFVPFCTDERQSYLRVRYCGQSRAVENQCFVVMAGTVGNLPGVDNMDIQYAQSCILTPCDFGFSRDGIAADTTPNVEMVSIADLRLDNLLTARNTGTVQNLKDRRFDLYHINWKDEKK